MKNVKFNKKNKTKRQNQRKQTQPQVEKPSTILRDILRYGGGLAGGYLGGPAGAAIGSSLGSSVSKFLGAGDYTVSKNNLVKDPTVLDMHTNKLEVRIVHKEYITDVFSSPSANTFNSQGFYINPGVSSTFPWLSAVAQQYQEYEFKGLIFEYVSATADAIASGTNTTIGTVMMGTNYRSTQQIYTDKVSLLASYFANDTKSANNFCHPIECDPKENPFQVQYVRGTSVPAGEDGKMYDLGLTTFASTGVQGTSVNLGELWVTYDIILKKPIDTATRALFSSYAHYSTPNQNINTHAAFTGLTPKYDNIGITFDTNHIFWPPGLLGNYLITVAYTGTITAANTGFVIGTAVNATVARSFANNLNLGVATQITSAGTGNNMIIELFIFIINPTVGGSIGIDGPAVVIGAGVVDVIFTQVNGSAVPSNTL